MKTLGLDLKITDNPIEMAKIGKQIFEIKPDLYNEKIVNAMKRQIARMMSNATDEEKLATFYRSIYDYWAYGFLIQQEFMFNLAEKSHEEKLEYITNCSRILYYNHLNDKVAADALFKNKYNCYKLFSEYYKRDVVLIKGEEDYENFSEFVKKHEDFVVKPLNLSLGFGIHKESLKNYDSPRALFEKLLDERQKVLREGERDYFLSKNQDVDFVLEEIIEQVPELSKLNPSSVNSVRITTIKVGDKVEIFYPWIKIGVRGSFVDNGGAGGFLAGVNKETGIVDTNLFNEAEHSINPLEFHPDSGVKILGFKIPRWDEAISLVKNLAGKLEKINYVGWDLALTSKGWCVIEGNNFGEILQQIIYQRGLKKDLEKIIGWKPSEKFWWE